MDLTLSFPWQVRYCGIVNLTPPWWRSTCWRETCFNERRSPVLPLRRWSTWQGRWRMCHGALAFWSLDPSHHSSELISLCVCVCVCVCVRAILPACMSLCVCVCMCIWWLWGSRKDYICHTFFEVVFTLNLSVNVTFLGYSIFDYVLSRTSLHS